MKLLVGGDSFAVFPDHHFKYRETRKYIDFPSSPKGEGFRQELNFKHWCQQLAETYDGTAVSIGIGSGDISSTTFVTIQELMANTYSHCIFFVTSFYRDIIEIGNKESINTPVFADDTSFDKIYGNMDMLNETVNRHHEFENEVISKYNKTYKLLGPHIWFDTDEMIGKHKSSIMQYMSRHADFKYIHDRLSNLYFLQKYCDDKDINLIFCLPFFDLPSSVSVAKMMESSLFFVYHQNKVMAGRENLPPDFYKWAITHHTKEEHTIIAHLFQKEYKEWLNK